MNKEGKRKTIVWFVRILIGINAAIVLGFLVYIWIRFWR